MAKDRLGSCEYESVMHPIMIAVQYASESAITAIKPVIVHRGGRINELLEETRESTKSTIDVLESTLSAKKHQQPRSAREIYDIEKQYGCGLHELRNSLNILDGKAPGVITIHTDAQGVWSQAPVSVNRLPSSEEPVWSAIAKGNGRLSEDALEIVAEAYNRCLPGHVGIDEKFKAWYYSFLDSNPNCEEIMGSVIAEIRKKWMQGQAF